MSDINFQCPFCKQLLDAPVDMTGQLITCPSCGKSIEVPKSAHQRNPPGRRPPPPPPFSPLQKGQAKPVLGAMLAIFVILIGVISIIFIIKNASSLIDRCPPCRNLRLIFAGHNRPSTLVSNETATGEQRPDDIRRDDLRVEPESIQVPEPATLEEKLKSIIIPAVEFRQANIVDVVNFLVEASIAADPDKAGVNIILNLGQSDSETAGVRDITLNLRRINMLDTIKYITEVAGLKYRIDPEAVVITLENVPSAYSPRSEPPSAVDQSGELGKLLEAKLKSIIIPAVEFRQANIVDVVNFLVEASIAADPDKAGVNIILNLGQSDSETAGVRDITLNLRRINMLDTIKQITKVTGLAYRIEDTAVIISNPNLDVR